MLSDNTLLEKKYIVRHNIDEYEIYYANIMFWISKILDLNN